MNMTDREVKSLIYRADSAETECQEWQYVADKLYRALVVEKNRRGVEFRDAKMIAEALEAYEKIA
jgi:hypothetical protein